MTGCFTDYSDGDTICEAYVALPDGRGTAPAVLVAHQWSGQSDHERATADKLSELGYVGIAIDVYGKGVRGQPGGDHSGLLAPWFGDRAALRRRLAASVDFAKGLERVDPGKIAVMGYCFGGLCALDLARAAIPDVKAAISVHGIFAAPNIGPQADITAKVLMLHGWEDPMATPADVESIAREMTEAGANWQLHAYGNTVHAFTAKHANDRAGGKQYNADADRRSWQATVNFLEEIFN